MKVRKIGAVMLVAVLVSGCSKVEITGTSEAEPEAIRMKPAISTLHPVSRAPFIGNLSSAAPLTAWVPATETSGSYTTTYANGTMTFSNTSTPVTYNAGFTGSENLPDGSDTELYLRGFYPSEGWTQPDNKATITIKGCEDIMIAAEVSTTKKKVREKIFATLAFEHQLTLLEIAVQTEDDAKAVDKWQKVSGISVSKTTGEIETSLTVDLSGNVATFGDLKNSLSTFALSGGTYSDSPYAGTTLVAGESESVAYILVPPLSDTGSIKKYKFNVKTLKGETETVSAIDVVLNDLSEAPFTNSTVGYSFKVTFYFLNGDIKTLATVQDWKTGGTSVVPVE